MAVQPLTKTKIIKKTTTHPNKFQSHQFKRLNVSFTNYYLDSKLLLTFLSKSIDQSLRDNNSFEKLEIERFLICACLEIMEKAQRY